MNGLLKNFKSRNPLSLMIHEIHHNHRIQIESMKFKLNRKKIRRSMFEHEQLHLRHKGMHLGPKNF